MAKNFSRLSFSSRRLRMPLRAQARMPFVAIFICAIFRLKIVAFNIRSIIAPIFCRLIHLYRCCRHINLTLRSVAMKCRPFARIICNCSRRSCRYAIYTCQTTARECMIFNRSNQLDSSRLFAICCWLIMD